MTKTENYQLNQWEPTDKISRADFNADNAAIDAALGAVAGAYGPNNPPWVTGKISLGSAESGDILVTFDFNPSAVIMFITGSTTGAAISGQIARVDYIDGGGYRLYALRNNYLKLTSTYGSNMSEVHYIAFR